MKLDLLKEHYFFELNRKQHLESALGFHVAVLATLWGLVGFYAQRYPLPKSKWGIAFDLPFVVFIVFLLFAFYYVVRSFIRFRYQVVEAGRLPDYYMRLKAYASGTADEAFDPDKDFEESVERRYAEAIERNSLANITRSAYLYWAKVWLACAAVSLALCAIPYFALGSVHTDTRQKIGATGPFETQSEKEKPVSGQPQKPPQKPQSPPVPKPEPPPNRETREGTPPSSK